MLNSSIKLAHKSIFCAVSRTQLLFNRDALAHPVSMGVTNGLWKNKDSWCQETVKLRAWKDFNQTWSGITIAHFLNLPLLFISDSFLESLYSSPFSKLLCPQRLPNLGYSPTGLHNGEHGWTGRKERRREWGNEVRLASLWTGCPWG